MIASDIMLYKKKKKKEKSGLDDGKQRLVFSDGVACGSHSWTSKLDISAKKK